MTGKFLYAFTESENYISYPQFVNFTRYDDEVRVTIRGAEIAGSPTASMTFSVEDARKLLTTALYELQS